MGKVLQSIVPDASEVCPDTFEAMADETRRQLLHMRDAGIDTRDVMVHITVRASALAAVMAE